MASTPWGASLRASASSRCRLTCSHGHPLVGGEVDDVGGHAGVVAVGGDPQLPHLAPAGQEQLPDGLAALDLLAAEALAAAGACAPRPRCRRRAAGATAGRAAGPAAAGRRGAAARGLRHGRSTRRPSASRPRVITATAQQAMPSPRPSAPRPSARRPFTVTGAPTASTAAPPSPRGAGASSGASHTTLQSTLPTSQPAARTRPATVAQQAERVGARPGRVGVGEVLAEVAEAGGAEQGVGGGVGDDVGVAVAGQAPVAREAHAAEHERPVGVVA